jgi:hypothetical protein
MTLPRSMPIWHWKGISPVVYRVNLMDTVVWTEQGLAFDGFPAAIAPANRHHDEKQ